MKKENTLMVPDEVVMNKIYFIRGQKVMLDRDLAELYGVATKALKQAVKRNVKRFPEDFMFAMSKEELSDWRSQFVTSKEDLMGLRYAPFCFTEQGVTMLSCILNSERAISVNIQIIRIFTRLREMVLTHKDLLIKMNELESKITDHDKSIKQIFAYLKQFIKEHEKPRQLIGFKTKKK